MPLVDFTTDLTTLRYGGDRPGGGWSGQPYIQSPNPDLPPNVTAQALDLFNDFYRANKSTSDYPIRGGAVDATGTLAGKIDRSRIGAFLADKTKGTIFKLKQQGLQLSNPNIQVPTILGTSDEFSILETTRYYSPNGDNTLLQTQLQGTGIHIPRHGLSPLLTLPYESTYQYFVTKNNTALSNRLAILTALKINTPLITRNTGTYDQNQANNPTILGFANRYGISPLTNQILNYTGGPGSLYGIGFTRINRATDTTEAATEAANFYNALTLTYAQIADQKTRDGRSRWSPTLQDFRAQLPEGGAMTASYNEEKAWYNRATLGDPGAVTSKNRIDYTKSTVKGVDRVNEVSPFYYRNDIPFWQTATQTKDIIKFGFECIDNDDPTKAIALVFRAFLTNFTDNHQAELNSFKYLGRGETFRTYQGFDRSISFNFKIAAQSRDELRPLYKKLNHLISQTYPDYAPNTQLMRGSVVKLTIGDYLYRVPGFLESVNITINDNASWEINLENSEDVNQVPQVVDVQCSFKPIHGFLPRRATRDDQFVPLIGSVSDDGKEGWLNYGIPEETYQLTVQQGAQRAALAGPPVAPNVPPPPPPPLRANVQASQGR